MSVLTALRAYVKIPLHFVRLPLVSIDTTRDGRQSLENAAHT